MVFEDNKAVFFEEPFANRISMTLSNLSDSIYKQAVMGYIIILRNI
jgi:hypothetical protein